MSVRRWSGVSPSSVTSNIGSPVGAGTDPSAGLIPARGAIASHGAGEIDLRIVRHCARGRPPETEFIPPQLIRRRSVAEGVSPNFSR